MTPRQNSPLASRAHPASIMVSPTKIVLPAPTPVRRSAMRTHFTQTVLQVHHLHSSQHQTASCVPALSSKLNRGDGIYWLQCQANSRDQESAFKHPIAPANKGSQRAGWVGDMPVGELAIGFSKFFCFFCITIGIFKRNMAHAIANITSNNLLVRQGNPCFPRSCGLH